MTKKDKNQRFSIHHKTNRKYLLLWPVLVVILVGALITLFVVNSSHKTTSPSPSSSLSPKPSTSTSSPETASSDTTKNEPTESTSELSPEIVPLIPSGTFVSNHHPNLSGTPAPNTITSTCSSTIGATCTIQFKSGSLTKSLPTQKINSEGYTTWTWTLQSIGLTVGSWEVTAIASNQTKTSSASDAMRLEVAE